jgi:hypothetical protein
MTDGSSKTLAITDLPDNVDAGVTSVAISSDGRLVAAGSLDTVCDLLLFVGMYSEYSPYRWCVFGMLAPVNCWRGCGDTEIACTVWRSPLMHVDW